MFTGDEKMEKNDNTNDKNIENQSETTPETNISDNVSSNVPDDTPITSSEPTETNLSEEKFAPSEKEKEPDINPKDSSINDSSTEEKKNTDDNSDSNVENETKKEKSDISTTVSDSEEANNASKQVTNTHASKQSRSKEKHFNKNKNSNEKNRIVKTKKTPEYLPGMQKKLFVDVRDEDELTIVDKLKRIFTDARSICSILIYVLMVINLIGITLFAKKCGLNITQSLLYKVHIDSLTFDTYTFLEISIIMSYIFAFIFGGLVTFAMVKIASLIAKNVSALYSHNLTRIILGGFIVICAIFTATSYVSSGGFLTIATQNWLIPLSTFAGGICMYCISLRNVEIN